MGVSRLRTRKGPEYRQSDFTLDFTGTAPTHRMIKLSCLLPLLACAVVFLGGNDAAEEEHGEAEGVCYKPELSQYSDLFKEAFTVTLGEDSEIYINCMSFAKNGELESAVVSGQDESGGESAVFAFKCKGSTLIAFESERTFSEAENKSCLECDTNSTARDACVTPCAEDCKRCYGTPDDCDCPTALVYDVTVVRNAVDDLSDEELGEEDEEIEAAIEEVIIENSRCESECEDDFELGEHGNEHICYACGIQFCLECKAEEEGGHDECTECLPHTVLYEEEGECLYGLDAEILEVVEEQEREVEEEEREKDMARTALAVTLPIACVLTVTFFLIMSFIAHKRYPHIGETGRTRHRNKPAESAEEELPIPDSVFRPRPTVRLR